MARERQGRAAPSPSLVLPGFPGVEVVEPGHATGGSMTTPARADHAHAGIAKITAGTGITVTGPPDAPIISASGGGGGGGAALDPINRLYVENPNGMTAFGTGTVLFNTITEDPTGAWNAVTGEWTAPLDGSYLFVANVGFNDFVDAGLSDLLLEIQLNAQAMVADYRQITLPGGFGVPTIYLGCTWRSAATIAGGWQVSAGNKLRVRAIVPANATPYFNIGHFSAQFLGPPG